MIYFLLVFAVGWILGPIRQLWAVPHFGRMAATLSVQAEIAGVVWVRGLSLREYLASFVTAPGIISLLMFLVFGAMPTLVTLLTRGRVGAIS